MKQVQIFPNIANVTDLRYRWTKIMDKLEEDKLPILVIEHSTPKAVIFSYDQARKLIKEEKLINLQDDPLIKWRKKYVKKFSNWNATEAIRKIRDTR